VFVDGRTSPPRRRSSRKAAGNSAALRWSASTTGSSSELHPSLARSHDLPHARRRRDVVHHAAVRFGLSRETLDQFNLPGRAIMKDGLYDDGLVRTHRWIDASQHKIGKSAQANALRSLQEQAEDIDKSLDDAAKEAGVADGAFIALKALCAAPAGELKACAAAFAAAQTEKADAQAKLTALDSAGDGGLREKKGAQQRLKNVRLAEQQTQQSTFNKHDGEVRLAKGRLGDGENVPGSELNLKIAWSIFLKNPAALRDGEGPACDDRCAPRMPRASRREPGHGEAGPSPSRRAAGF